MSWTPKTWRTSFSLPKRRKTLAFTADAALYSISLYFFAEGGEEPAGLVCDSSLEISDGAAGGIRAAEW